MGDRHHLTSAAPNARVIMGVDRDGFADLLVEAVKAYGEGQA